MIKIWGSSIDDLARSFQGATAIASKQSNWKQVEEIVNSSVGKTNGTSVVTKASPKIEADPVNFYKGIAAPHELGGYQIGMKPIVIQPQKGVNAGTTTIVVDGPTRVKLREPVNLSEVERLDTIDIASLSKNRGEASAVAELQNILGGKLRRVTDSDMSEADFIIEDGLNKGKSIDFMFTSNSRGASYYINKHFEKNWRRQTGTKEQIIYHLEKADIVPLDLRNLDMQHRAKIIDFIYNNLSLEQRSRIIIME